VIVVVLSSEQLGFMEHCRKKRIVLAHELEVTWTLGPSARLPFHVDVVPLGDNKECPSISGFVAVASGWGRRALGLLGKLRTHFGFLNRCVESKPVTLIYNPAILRKLVIRINAREHSITLTRTSSGDFQSVTAARAQPAGQGAIRLKSRFRCWNAESVGLRATESAQGCNPPHRLCRFSLKNLNKVVHFSP
jgi:hypothetical protein